MMKIQSSLGLKATCAMMRRLGGAHGYFICSEIYEKEKTTQKTTQLTSYILGFDAKLQYFVYSTAREGFFFFFLIFNFI